MRVKFESIEDKGNCRRCGDPLNDEVCALCGHPAVCATLAGGAIAFSCRRHIASVSGQLLESLRAVALAVASVKLITMHGPNRFHCRRCRKPIEDGSRYGWLSGGPYCLGCLVPRFSKP